MALAGVLGGWVAVLMGGCGQQGPLYIPKDDPAAAQRATLPEALLNTVRTPKTPQPLASVPGAAASMPTPAQPATP